MVRSFYPARCFALLIAVGSLGLPIASAQEKSPTKASALTPGSRVAIVGDSITEQKLYSKFMEAYLLACTGVQDVHVFQFGWSGEQASGFAARLENDLTVFNPTIATLCYGMNDGGYQPYRDEIGTNYERNMRNVLDGLAKLGVKSVVVGSPGAVDSHFFRPGQLMGDAPAHAAYNNTLARLTDVDRNLAKEKGLMFANVHSAMFDAMTKAQEKLGKDYNVCGRDGFHPGNNGQLLMAYAFLKGLGLDGNIGEVNIDMKGTSKASDGHKLVSSNANQMELESTRWPFCFQGDATNPDSTRSIVPFTSFNSDLNRLTLKVSGLDTPNAMVKWGSTEKSFTKEQLAAGINLAAEFNETPFDAPFQKLLEAIANKQNFETHIIKSIITNLRAIPSDMRSDTELSNALSTVRSKLAGRQKQLDDIVHEQLTPVRHTIQVTAMK